MFIINSHFPGWIYFSSPTPQLSPKVFVEKFEDYTHSAYTHHQRWTIPQHLATVANPTTAINLIFRNQKS